MEVALLLSFMTYDSSSRIVAELTQWIDSAAPGEKLPSSRSLVARFQASPVTVQKALSTLARRGLVESRPGVGTFVRAVRSIAPPDLSWQTAALSQREPAFTSSMAALQIASNDVFALHSGYPDPGLLPKDLVRTALNRMARTENSLRRAPTAGDGDLQSWFATELADGTSRHVSEPNPSDVTIIPGSQSGLASILRSVVGSGGSLVVESPTYWGLIAAARHSGVRLIPVPSGIDGPSPDVLDEAFERSGATAFYAQPNFANPTGAHWSPNLRADVLDLVRSRRAFLVEDDWAHDFGIDAVSQPLVADDADGHIIYIRSLTKSVSPALRVAAVVARGPARERIRTVVSAEAMYVSPILQAAALDVVTRPAWRTHLRSLGRQLRTRRDSLAAALRAEAPDLRLEQVPTGGLNLWVRLPLGIDVDEFVKAAADVNVLITGGADWFPAEAPAGFVRLNFAGPNPAGFTEAMRRLGEALAQLQAR